MSFKISSNSRAKKIYFGFVLLAVAAAIVCFAIGLGPVLMGVSLYKIILGLVLLSWMIYKIVFSAELRQRFQLAIPLALLFILFESEIAAWTNAPEANIVNNWLILLAAVVCHIAVAFIIPNKKSPCEKKGEGSGNHTGNHTFTAGVMYIDAEKSPCASVYNKLGGREVYYQNTANVSPDTNLTLNIDNNKGSIVIHVPSDWVVTDKVESSMASINIRQGSGSGATLTLTGSNIMGAIQVV